MKSKKKKISRRLKKISKKKSARKKSGRVLKKKRIKKAKLKKRRGQDIYDILLPSGNKSEQDIDEMLQNIPYRNIKSEDVFIKLTFYERKGKDYAAFTRLSEYDYEDKADLLRQVKQEILDMNYTFFRQPAKDAKEYWKRMYKLKNYLNKITIDFETAS